MNQSNFCQYSCVVCVCIDYGRGGRAVNISVALAPAYGQPFILPRHTSLRHSLHTVGKWQLWLHFNTVQCPQYYGLQVKNPIIYLYNVHCTVHKSENLNHFRSVKELLFKNTKSIRHFRKCRLTAWTATIRLFLLYSTVWLKHFVFV